MTTAPPAPNTQAAPAQRAMCNTCLRPERSCICQWITPTAHQVEVVILQHPLEVHQADQRLTLEATCAALAQLESRPLAFAPLLQAFTGFVAQQSGYRGAVLERTAPKGAL